jgi:hypothetical protein
LSIKQKLKPIYTRVTGDAHRHEKKLKLLLGKQMAWQVASLPPNTSLRKVGFSVFSQWDEDGILQYLVAHLPITKRTFIEFGVENYEESNTRFLLMNNHWQGMVLDACKEDIRHIQRDQIYWQYDLQAKCTWITRENINELMREANFGEDVGLLSIDIDGNDYWIWEAIHSIRPRIVVVEYNSLFGLRPLAVPYKDDFHRTASHFSNLYYGSSLGALHCLAQKKGYCLVGSNVWGHNAFFIRADIAGEFRDLEPRQAYVASKFRESRDAGGKLTYARGNDRIKIIQDMPVIDVSTGRTDRIKDVWEDPGIV